MGSKAYELSDHLGNVTVTVSDLERELPETRFALYGIATLSSTEVAYVAQVLSYTNYYAFGMSMPGRNKTSEAYRYGFNGKENDKEWGTGLIQDYGFRLYNPSIAKFLSVDPLTASYPGLTPYQFASNQPIESVDLDGLERLDYKLTLERNGSTTLKLTGSLPSKYYSTVNKVWNFLTGSDDHIKLPYHVRVEYNGQFYVFADAGVHETLKKLPVDGSRTLTVENPYTKQDLQDFIKNPDAFAANCESENASYSEVVLAQQVYMQGTIAQATAESSLRMSTGVKMRKPKSNYGGPIKKLPRKVGGEPAPDPDATGPHTRLSTKTGKNGKVYTQAREFDENGNVVKDIDFTDHGRPGPGHENPHQHTYAPNKTGGTPTREDGIPFELPIELK